MENPSTLVDIVQAAGVIGLLCLIVWALLGRKVVTRGELDERVSGLEKALVDAISEARFWRDLFLRALNVGGQATGTAAQLAGVPEILKPSHDLEERIRRLEEKDRRGRTKS